MPKRNPVARALRTPLYRTRRTKTQAEKIRHPNGSTAGVQTCG